MPAVTLAICGNRILIQARAPRLLRLFADYFHYYDPQILTSTETAAVSAEGDPSLKIELNFRRELPPRAILIPVAAKLFSQTGVISLWREMNSPVGERFYFDLGVAAFRVDVETGRAVGLVTPQSLEYPHILANTYALFALLLLLRSRKLYHLHAAGIVSPRDELWLICGAQRAGKTTLTTALGLAGWRPVSDDSLLVGSDETSAWLTPLRKYFHLGDELLRRWPELDGIARHHQYLDRTCTGGLEFFNTRKLAETEFRRIDHIVLPQIVNETVSRVEPLSKSDALLRLAEQSMFFQLWREHTVEQWRALNDLAASAVCHRLFSAQDILTDPHCAGRILLEAAA
ncbi:MAG TPA: hypothetical protein PLD20_10755 [Blastocatellia bacterium]|nr:hypothetical protein [Blastocatellia bacterium]HMY70329.1 hypothetical protein [Blastocatellia bacterium]HMZ18400.1 hypothetical protein [Blastocatellia bacterium]HNG32246.1 hypothetical protein [Blastocatellia bacterium]